MKLDPNDNLTVTDISMGAYGAVADDDSPQTWRCLWCDSRGQGDGGTNCQECGASGPITWRGETNAHLRGLVRVSGG